MLVSRYKYTIFFKIDLRRKERVMWVKGKERRAVWISLLLVGALSVPSVTPIWANDGSEMYIQGADEPVDGVSIDTISASAMYEGEEDTDDMISGQEDKEQDAESENRTGTQLVLSMDSMFSDTVSDNNRDVVSENKAVDTEGQEKMFNVVLPTEISCDMILWGEERLKGAIRSKQFYMENKGYEDVRLSIQAICSGLKNEPYLIRDTSVEDDAVQGMKNVWIYLRWEDENGKELEQPGIIMGDASAPGEGEIVLKAPRRDDEGNIQGEDPRSKIYFSFFGDINSDTSSIWESDELGLELKWMMEEVVSEEALDMPGQSEEEDRGRVENISDNGVGTGVDDDISDDGTVDAYHSLSGNTEGVNMPDTMLETHDLEDQRKIVSGNVSGADMLDVVISQDQSVY